MLKKIITTVLLSFIILPSADGNNKIKAVTSIAPLAFFIENVGGDRVNVTTLIPPGGNPHTYAPTPRQMNILSEADLYVKAGSGIEFELMWMKRIEALNKTMVICDASKGISLIDIEDNEHGNKYAKGHEGDPSPRGRKDPHIWLSPVNAIIITENIRDSLSEKDPENSDYYYDKALSLIDDLKTLKQNITIELNNISKRQFFTFHPAWAYFARDFNLEQVPVEYSGKDPTPERLEKLVKKAIKENIKVIFTSPQFSKRSADVIAGEIKGKVVYIDPLSRDYIKNLEQTAKILQENLK